MRKPGAVNEGEYELASIRAVERSVLVVSYTRIEADKSPARRTSHVDDLGVRSITTDDRTRFVTCFHQHDMFRRHYDPASTPPRQVHKIAIDALLYEEWTGRLRSPRPELRKLAKKR